MNLGGILFTRTLLISVAALKLRAGAANTRAQINHYSRKNSFYSLSVKAVTAWKLKDDVSKNVLQFNLSEIIKYF